MLRWFRSLFAWRTIRNTGVHLYQANGVTGVRRVVRIVAEGHQPVDSCWLETGSWFIPPQSFRPR